MQSLSNTQPPTSQPVISQPGIQFVTKATCVAPGCRSTGRVANDCHHRLCKKHCLGEHTPCGFKSHDQERRALAFIPVPQVTIDPFELTQPKPSIPLAPTPTPYPVDVPSPAFNSGPPTSRTYRVDMPEDMKREWDERAQALLKKREAEEQRRKHLAQVEHSVTVHIWLQDNDSPVAFNVQEITAWPMFTLASQPDVVLHLGGTADLPVERYNLATRTWVRQRLSHALKVRSHEHLLFRLLGVSMCAGLAAICLIASERSDSSLNSLVTATSAMSLDSQSSCDPVYAGASGSDYATPPNGLFSSSIHCGTAPPAIHTAAHTATAVEIQPAPLTSPAQHAFLTTPPTEDLRPPHFVPTFTLAEMDRLWEYGVVHTPENRRPWPAGVYARDMAQAFALIGEMNEGLVTRFQRVFQGRPFVSSTYQAQRYAWLNSTEEERKWITDQPCTPSGLWITCRKELSGWKKISRHRSRGAGNTEGA
ncbi:hypothetical protein GY45DRAFT_1238388 [Cubamyces sp. BRFM 1775]|nr:hypothetical protein GY45DRAFT_1238388 [Cubamyces sp. BRFM 1775]